MVADLARAGPVENRFAEALQQFGDAETHGNGVPKFAGNAGAQPTPGDDPGEHRLQVLSGPEEVPVDGVPRKRFGNRDHGSSLLHSCSARCPARSTVLPSLSPTRMGLFYGNLSCQGQP